VTSDQAFVFVVLGAALVLFVQGRLRYDIVAIVALLAVTLRGIVSAEEAFTGFGHPAVITVVGILIVSRGLQNAGVVDALGRIVARVGDSPNVQVPVLTGLVASISGFMNNVGALALLLPVTLRVARRSGNQPSILLMPLAFGSLLGGLITLIGTPPNVIIATFRAGDGTEPFRMFDFAPVGLGIAVVGVIFVSTLGWRLIPRREEAHEGRFRVEDYLTELLVPDDSRLIGRPLSELDAALDPGAVAVIELIRGDHRAMSPGGAEHLRPGDILLLKVDSESLEGLVQDSGLELVASKEVGEEAGHEAREMDLMEVVVLPRSPLVGRTARGMRLRRRYGLNLLAVSRQGQPLYERLYGIPFRPGDVLLLQGHSEAIQEVVTNLGCLPLAERGIRLGQPRKLALALLVFAAAITTAALGLVEIQIAFIGGAVAMLLLNVLNLEEVYDAIDWPIVVLLGAMIPVAGALEVTGGAELVAGELVGLTEGGPIWLVLVVILVTTMFLSDLVNNAAAAVVMAPIAFGVAAGLDVSGRPLPHGSRRWRLLRLPDANRPSVQHPRPRPGRLPLRRLLAHGPASRGDHRRRRHTFDPSRLAALGRDGAIIHVMRPETDRPRFLILAPLDETQRSREVLPWVRPLGGLAGSRVRLLSVWPERPRDENAEQERRAFLEGFLRDTASALTDAGIEIETAVRFGKPADEIVAEASDCGAGIIVLATRAHTGVRRLLLGSVADEVLAEAPCPVLVVGPDVKRTPETLSSLLLTVDGSDNDEEALPWARLFADRFGLTLHLARVVEPPPLIADPETAYRQADTFDEAKKRADEILAALAERAGARTPVVTRRLEGDPAEQILWYAESNSIDLVVASSQRRRGLLRWVAGSVTDALLHGPAPLLIIRRGVAPPVA
jgi:di/tricarboxylate transporter/nucleotide-binding universal stress UspA family protein